MVPGILEASGQEKVALLRESHWKEARLGSLSSPGQGPHTPELDGRSHPSLSDWSLSAFNGFGKSFNS